MRSLLFIWSISDLKMRRKFFLFVVLSVLFAIVEIVCVGSFYPFVSFINTQNVQDNRVLTVLYNFFGTPEKKHFAFYLGGLTIILLVINAVYKWTLSKMRVDFGNQVYQTFTTLLLKSYLYLPYSYYAHNNSSLFLKNVTKEVTSLRTVVNIFTEIIVEGLKFIGIIIFLITINLKLSIFAIIISVFFMGMLSRLVRKALGKAGKRAEISFRQVYKISKEIFDTIKELKVMNKGLFFYNKFAQVVHDYSLANKEIAIYQAGPPILIDFFSYFFFILVTFYLIYSSGSFESAIPILSLFAVGLQRVKPSISAITSGIAQIYASEASILVLKNVFDESEKNKEIPLYAPLVFTKKISISNLSFSYENDKKVLIDINFDIKKNSSIGIVGKSGSGKSSFINILLGLYPRGYSGEIKVDGQLISLNNFLGFQALFGYIPQDVVLIDASIAENIAFGELSERIDLERLKRVSQIAQIEEFIEKLPSKYNQLIGERGVRISGGERQRIGIARALYKNSDILVFDEATSALDNETEAQLQHSIQTLSYEKTLLIVAHRLSTVEKCEKIIVFDQGRIIAIDTFNNLLKSCAEFQELYYHGNLVGLE